MEIPMEMCTMWGRGGRGGQGLRKAHLARVYISCTCDVAHCSRPPPTHTHHPMGKKRHFCFNVASFATYDQAGFCLLACLMKRRSNLVPPELELERKGIFVAMSALRKRWLPRRRNRRRSMPTSSEQTAQLYSCSLYNLRRHWSRSHAPTRRRS